MTNTYESRGKEINSLISLLGIQPAQITAKVEISKDTEIILNAVSNLSLRIQEIEQRSLNSPRISQIFYEDVNSMKLLKSSEVLDMNGQFIYHSKFGKGKIIAHHFVNNNENNPIVEIDFDAHGPKKIMLNYAKLYIPVTSEVKSNLRPSSRS